MSGSKPGKESNSYKHGLSDTKEYWTMRRRARGVKPKGWKYGGDKSLWPSSSKEYRRAYYQKNKEKYRQIGRFHMISRRSKPGKITKHTLQMLMEDNIKKFGTLTCYLCLEPLEIGKDCIEHMTPLSRGGTNHYDNLAISCRPCNCKKRNKTLEEYHF